MGYSGGRARRLVAATVVGLLVGVLLVSTLPLVVAKGGGDGDGGGGEKGGAGGDGPPGHGNAAANGNAGGNGNADGNGNGQRPDHGAAPAAAPQDGPHKKESSTLDPAARQDEHEAQKSSKESPSKKDDEVGRPATVGKPAPPIVQPSHDLTHTLRVKRVDHDQELHWIPTDPDTVGYQIWRSNSPFALVATVPADANTYVDTAAPTNSKYKVTYYTGEAIEQGYVSPNTPPAELPEWNPSVYAAASLEAPVIINAPDGGDLSFWIAVGEGLLLLGGLSFAVARPDLSAQAFRGTRSAFLRFTAQFTLSLIVFGEGFERLLGVRILSRLSDREVLSLFQFMMSPEAAPKVEAARPEPEPTPRLTITKLHRPETEPTLS